MTDDRKERRRPKLAESLASLWSKDINMAVAYSVATLEFASKDNVLMKAISSSKERLNGR
jgi:hypothetical protein